MGLGVGDEKQRIFSDFYWEIKVILNVKQESSGTCLVHEKGMLSSITITDVWSNRIKLYRVVSV